MYSLKRKERKKYVATYFLLLFTAYSYFACPKIMNGSKDSSSPLFSSVPKSSTKMVIPKLVLLVKTCTSPPATDAQALAGHLYLALPQSPTRVCQVQH